MISFFQNVIINFFRVYIASSKHEEVCKHGKSTLLLLNPFFLILMFQWNLICDKANIAAVVQSIFVAGMMAGSLFFGVISDYFGRRFCLFLCSALAVSET